MRIEKNQDIKQELENTKKELTAQINRGSKKRHPLLTCTTAIILLIVLLVVWAAFFIARTGLVQIPVFTSLFYQAPEPTRYVLATSPVEKSAADQLTALVNQQFQSYQGLEIDRGITIDLTEGSFTASSRELLTTVEKAIDPSQAQVAVIKPDRLEVFVLIKDNPLNSAVVVNLLPEINDQGLLNVEYGEVYVGSAKLPSWLIRFFFNRPLDLIVSELNNGLGQYVKIQSLSVEDGFVNLSAELTVEIIGL